MEKVLFLLLSFAVVSFTQSTERQTACGTHPREHRGFYNSADFGFGYISAFSEEENDAARYRFREKTSESKNAYGFTFPTLEFKVGTAVGNLVAFHSVFSLALYSGENDYKYERYRRDYEKSADGEYYDGSNEKAEAFAGDWYRDGYTSDSKDAFVFNTFIGFGMTFYPFMDADSPMNGAFVGGAIGYSADLTIPVGKGSGDNDLWGGFGRRFQVEIGKEWWLNDLLSLGVGLTYGHTQLYLEDRIGEINSITISFRLTRG